MRGLNLDAHGFALGRGRGVRLDYELMRERQIDAPSTQKTANAIVLILIRHSFFRTLNAHRCYFFIKSNTMRPAGQPLFAFCGNAEPP